MNPNDNPMNDNPIFGIIERGNLQQIKELFGKTYNLNTLNGVDADTIIFASQKGQLEIVKYLIDKIDEAERDYRINYRDCDGISALQWAAYNGHPKIVKLLIENGANVNNKANDGRTPLIEATQRGHLEIAKLLLENGADVNKGDAIFKNLELASGNGNLEIIKYLVNKGVNVDKNFLAEHIPGTWLDNGNNDDSRHFDDNETENAEIIKFLIENGVDVNAKNKDGLTALEKICDYGHGNKKMAETLIELGANISDFAFISATGNRHLDLMKLFVDNGYKIKNDILSNDFSILYRYSNNVKFLLEQGVNVNAKDRESSITPLMRACRESNLEVIKLLIEYGADVNAKDNNGETALDYANNKYESEKKQFVKSYKFEDMGKICNLLKQKMLDAEITQQDGIKSNLRRPK